MAVISARVPRPLELRRGLPDGLLLQLFEIDAFEFVRASRPRPRHSLGAVCEDLWRSIASPVLQAFGSARPRSSQASLAFNAWLLIPRLILTDNVFVQGRASHEDRDKAWAALLAFRVSAFWQGDVAALVRATGLAVSPSGVPQSRPRPPRLPPASDLEARAARASSAFACGNFRRTKDALIGAPLAPGTSLVASKLQASRVRERVAPIRLFPLPDVWSPEQRETTLPRDALFRTIALDNSSGGNGASGLLGTHVQPLLASREGREALYSAALRIGAGEVPSDENDPVARAYRAAIMLGLQPSPSKTRGCP